MNQARESPLLFIPDHAFNFAFRAVRVYMIIRQNIYDLVRLKRKMSKV